MSMAGLALRPRLAKGVEGDDYQVRRGFEVYGGRHAMEPDRFIDPKYCWYPKAIKSESDRRKMESNPFDMEALYLFAHCIHFERSGAAI
jgi:hypothetical protein